MLVYVLREAKGTPTYSTKQKQDNSNKPSNTTDNRTTENSLGALMLAFLVSSATLPEASKPMRIPAVAR
jgi:hypothetical protein